MPNLMKSIVINAPLEKVFEFLNKPENLKEIYPRIVEILDITPLANSCHTYRWKFSMVAGIQREVTSENTEIIPNKKISTKNTCGLKGWRFVFIDETMDFDTIDGKTKIVYKAVNDVTIPVVGRLMALIQIQMINMFIDKCLKNLKAKMES